MIEAGRQVGETGSGSGGRRIAAWVAVVLGICGLAASAFGVAIQVLPRHFTAGQQQALAAWQVGARWRGFPAGRVFPASIAYQLPDTVVIDDPPLLLHALRVVIAPQAACAAAATGATVAVLRRSGCEAVLRAMYEDETGSFVMTVGVAVLPSAAAAAAAQAALSQAALTPDAGGIALSVAHGGEPLTIRLPGLRPYDYYRQLSAVLTAGPYLVLYSAGYADGRPRVQLGHDSYAQAEISSMAQGVASAIAGDLGAPPPLARCPGSPGC